MSLPTRQVHLDFHTGPQIPDVGATFDPAAFGETLQRARVNSITLFAKCHHGLLYYDTNRPERHPTLPRSLDLLGQQVEACRRHGIRAPIYLSVQCDEYAATLHPDWIAINPDGTHVGSKPLESGWQILDMSSPYADFLAEQIEEVVRLFKPVDGIFLDMCWDQISVSKWALAGMRNANLNPEVEADQNTYATRVAQSYMKRYNDLITSVHGSLPRVWYNSRPKVKLVEEAKYLKHVEIEALPTGGWGYTYFPFNVRYARNFGLPYLGMTARFHKSWSDFGGFKPQAALMYECCQMLAHGASCSVGDQLHPRGTLDAGAYELIGNVYRHVEECEPFCVGAKPVTEVAVLRAPGSYHVAPGDTNEGVVRLLQQLFIQFDFLDASMDLSRFRMLIVPEAHPMDSALVQKIQQYVRAGGKLIVSGVNEQTPADLKTITGVGSVSPASFRTVFARFDPKLVHNVLATDYVLYEPTFLLTASSGATPLATIVEPYFERTFTHFSGHNQTPPADATRFTPATLSNDGAAFGFDLFKAYATHGSTSLRSMFAAVINRLLPVPLVKSDAPSHAEISVTKQSERDIVHVLSFCPQRRTPTLDLVEEATPLAEVSISLRVARPVKRVSLQPGNTPVTFVMGGGYVSLNLTSRHGHNMIVIE